MSMMPYWAVHVSSSANDNAMPPAASNTRLVITCRGSTIVATRLTSGVMIAIPNSAMGSMLLPSIRGPTSG